MFISLNFMPFRLKSRITRKEDCQMGYEIIIIEENLVWTY